MVWKLPKLSKFAGNYPKWRPSRETLRRTALAGLLAASVAGAFLWGRHGGLYQARAQAPKQQLIDPSVIQQAAHGDRGRHVVAYIYGNIPVTREELGEYLVERMGADHLEFLVNRKIIEKACEAKNIRITDAEINAQLEEDIKMCAELGIRNEREFVAKFLAPKGKTLLMWKEDVIRPKLAMQRYVQDNIKVEHQEIAKAFEARFGPKVECRAIVLTKEEAKDKFKVWTDASKGPAEFEKCAKEQSIREFAAQGGKVPPIHKHFKDPNVEREAFKLRKGEISTLIGMPDGTHVILQCVDHIPADTTKSLEKERLALHRDIYDAKLAETIKMVFPEMRKAADPQLFLRREAMTVSPSYGAPQMPSAPPAAGQTPPNVVPPPPQGVVPPMPSALPQEAPK